MTSVLLDSIIYLQKDVQVVSLKKGKILQPFLQEETLTRGLEIKSIQLHRPCPTYEGL